MIKNLFAKANSGLSSIVILHFLILLFYPYSSGSKILFESEMSIRKLTNDKIKVGVFELDQKDVDWIDSTMKSLPLYEKCAQVFMPAVFGKNLDTASMEFKNTVELVQAHGLGGIVISEGGVDETAAMINKLQEQAQIPLLVSADFENGVGMRIRGTNVFPQNMALSAAHNPRFAYEMGKAISKEALMLGVNINFAPVADINNNPDNPVINLRSFSESKKIVYNFCKEFIEGSEETGIISTAKHFPGHGDTKVDSHKELPIINGSKDYLFKNELFPFIELIKDNVPAIMVGHLSVPAFESEKNLPSSLSYNIVTKLLKEELGFKGLIITDALDMRAVTNYFSDAEAVIAAFKAGNDILLMPPDVKVGVKALYEAVKSGEISEERLNESVRKILAAKRWLKLYNHRTVNTDNLSKRILVNEHQKLSEEIARNSVTIVKMDKTFYPLNPQDYKKVLQIDITNRKNLSDTFLDSISSSKFKGYKNLSLTLQSKNKDYTAALNEVNKSDLIILASYFSVYQNGNGSVLPDNQFEFLNKILSSNKNVIFFSFRNPYILSLFPETKNYICTYSDVQVSQQAALDVLLGYYKPNGFLPISIPNTVYKIGYRWNTDK